MWCQSLSYSQTTSTQPHHRTAHSSECTSEFPSQQNLNEEHVLIRLPISTCRWQRGVRLASAPAVLVLQPMGRSQTTRNEEARHCQSSENKKVRTLYYNTSKDQKNNKSLSWGKKKFFSKQLLDARGILSLHLYQITDIFSGKITRGTSLDQKKRKQLDLPLEPQHNGCNSVDST